MIEPTALSTSFAHIRWRKAAAPGPDTSILANELSSKSPACSRVATASAWMAGDQCCPAHPRGRSPSSPCTAFGSNQFGRSQPDFSPKTAPSAATRS